MFIEDLFQTIWDLLYTNCGPLVKILVFFSHIHEKVQPEVYQRFRRGNNSSETLKYIYSLRGKVYIGYLLQIIWDLLYTKYGPLVLSDFLTPSCEKGPP